MTLEEAKKIVAAPRTVEINNETTGIDALVLLSIEAAEKIGTAKGFIEGYEQAVKECAEIAREACFDHMKREEFTTGNDYRANMVITIEREIISLLEQKP